MLRLTTDTSILKRQPIVAEDYPPSLLASLERLFGEPISPDAAVARILADVRTRGDAALRDWTKRIDNIDLNSISVKSVQSVDQSLISNLRFAADRIRSFHVQQPIRSWQTADGTLGQRVTPIERVGFYVPGGSAPLPSSLLMSVIPAQVAGVKEIVVCTPPGKPNGDIPPVILAAAHICGIERVYRIGGAQAIAAMAFGTESVPRVNKIVGPGNLFVTLAKRQVFGVVGLDGLAGPTETVVVADDSAHPAWVAADLLAQAEHDPLASAILLTPSRPLAEAVQVEVGRQMESLSRADIIAQSFANRSGIVLTPDLATAVRLANIYAPEHLCLSVEHPEQWADQITCAGGLFMGEQSFEVLGDYVAGPSHVMPTGGTARFASPLNVLDFVRITSVISLDAATAAQLSPVAAALARAESLDAHANAALLRSRDAGGSRQ
ncbi:MAG TPA: histidinol dehydrogenase [Anaerolineales bacterium]|nr:histidinol dehydrogenase [Anaerolineales bacterium]